MKLISLWEPWSTLMALGLKTIETRSWSTSYRGWLAIQASKGGLSKEEFLDTVEDTPGIFAALSTVPGFCEWFNRRGKGMKLSEVLPLGKIVAVVNLTDCVPVVSGGNGLCLKYANAEAVRQRESYFGDYSCAGRYGWMTDKLFRLPGPVPFTAKQGLCDVDSVTLELIRQQWRERAA